MTSERPGKPSLDQLLSELHEELQALDDSAENSRELLHTVLGDIRTRLDEHGDLGTESGGVALRLREAMDHFEESHPDLTRILGRVADALSNMGI